MGCCDPKTKITGQLRLYFTVILILSFLSCTIYDNNLDNPNDNEANEELGRSEEHASELQSQD